MENNKAPNIEALEKSLGATAEMSLIFMRATLGAGATTEEAIRVTQAYIGALLFGRPREPKLPEGK